MSNKPKKQNKKQKTTVNHITRREFNYNRNGYGNQNSIDLNFKLRVDVTEELEGFRELLVDAIADIDIELAKLKKKLWQTKH